MPAMWCGLSRPETLLCCGNTVVGLCKFLSLPGILSWDCALVCPYTGHTTERLCLLIRDPLIDVTGEVLSDMRNNYLPSCQLGVTEKKSSNSITCNL